MNDDEGIIGYMCKIAYDCELGLAMGGNVIYPSEEDLKRCHTCWETCGIVKVRVHYVCTVVEEDFSRDEE